MCIEAARHDAVVDIATWHCLDANTSAATGCGRVVVSTSVCSAEGLAERAFRTARSRCCCIAAAMTIAEESR